MFQARSTSSRSSEGNPSPSSPMAATTAAASGATLNASSDSNLDDDPNSSIINKVRSRVSSILPDALSKWFSPSAAKRPRDTDNSNSGSNTPAGRNGNLLRLYRRESSSSDPDDDMLQRDEEHHRQRDEEEEDDEDHAPPIRKKKRLEESFNTSLTNYSEMGAIAGPSGLNISAIDRRSSLTAGAQLPRSIFSSSTPSTSPQGSAPHGTTIISRPQKTSTLIGYSNRTRAPFNFETSAIGAGGSSAPIGEELEQQPQHQADSLSTSIRHRRGIREVSTRKRLNIPPMAVDRSTSEPPAPIFGAKTIFGRSNQLSQQQSSSEELIEEDLTRRGREELESKTLSNGNMNESASETSSISNLNLSHTDRAESRRLSGFMGNNRSKRMRVGGSTGDLCFSSHLETEKSLFSMKNTGRAERATFNASLYSLSSLGSSNSSLFANSPFYNGRTMYGGASAYSVRRDIRQKALRVPVQMRPSSALSNFSSSNASLASDTSALSNTAKRILEIMNQCSGPLNEARKLGSSLSLNSTLASAKVPGLVQARKRFNEEDLSINRSIRMSSPRTPYSRPLSATGNSTSSSVNKPPTAELQIASVSQLLHMKRLQTNTESVRRLATESVGSTVLNEPTAYKLPSDKDDSNNNVKHTSKMRSKLHRVREESHSDRGSNTPVPQVNLPEVQLIGLKSVPKIDIKLPTGTSTGGSSSTASKNGTGASTSWTKPAVTSLDSTRDTNQQKNTTKPDIKNCSDCGADSRSTKTSSLPTVNNNNVFKFSDPVNLPAYSAVATSTELKNSFKFSNPELIGTPKKGSTDKAVKLSAFEFNPELAKPKTVTTTTSSGTSPAKAPVPLKSGSCLDAFKTSSVPVNSGAAPVNPDQGFKALAAQQSANKWECSACMTRNEASRSKCACCDQAKPGSTPSNAPSFSFGSSAAAAAAAAATSAAAAKFTFGVPPSTESKESPKSSGVPASTTSSSTPTTGDFKALATTGDFKALAAQQSANKWECSACMTRNESSRSKCACCEQAKPGSTPSNAPSFSFGSTPTSSAKFSFGATPSTESKESPKSGFSFGVPASTTSSSTPAAGGFTFGNVTSESATAGTAEKPKFSFGSSSNTTGSTAPAPAGSGFSFGVKPVISSDATDSSKTEKKEDVKPVSSVGSGGFSFSKASTSDETKQSEAVTSTTATSFGSAASKPSVPAVDKPTVSVSFGSIAAGSTSTPASSAPSFSFGSTTAKVTSSETKPAATGTGFVSFGSSKPAAVVVATPSPTSESKDPAASGVAPSPSVPIFGGAQKPSGPSITPSFSFGASAGTVASSSTTSSSTTTSSTSTTAAVASGGAAAASATSFVFGQSTHSVNKVIPSFGAVASTTDKPTFSTFGAAAASSSPASTVGSSIFGGATAPTGSSGFSFASSASPSVAKPAESTNAFTFGASKTTSASAASAATFGSPAATPVTKSMFGGPSTNTATFGGFGGNNSTPTFGSSTFGSASSATGTTTGSIFGQSSVPAFGAPTGSTTASVAPTFGTAPSAFGGVANASNPFGAPVSTGAVTSDEPQTKKAFEFGSNSSVNNQPAAPFQFGASSNNNNNNEAKPFAFSAHSQPNFNFTAGSNAGQTAAPVAAPAFQFGAAPMPQQNPFAATSIPGQTQQQQARRKIRATRRTTPR